MSLLPELKRCPCCDTVNLVRNSGNAIEQDNPFKNLKNWKLIKKFICRKCKEELGFFSNNSSLKSETKLIWLNNLNIEENYFNILIHGFSPSFSFYLDKRILMKLRLHCN